MTEIPKQYPTRNQVQVGLKDNIIEVRIEAISPEVAQKLFEKIESTCIELVRTFLEIDWHKP